MLLRIILLFALCLWFSSDLYCVEIFGKVVNKNGEAVSTLVVQIKKLKLGTLTDKEGNYKLTNVPNGKHSLQFYRVDTRTIDTLIEVKNSQSIVVNIIVEEKYLLKDNVTVTGTRTIKDLESSPIITKVVGAKEIQQSGMLRLNDVLNEQIGLFIVEEMGKGVQIQGLDPSYTLILINGEPIIGKNAGTLDLGRLAVGNIKRVEIVKGPSSSLYGSDALAGVINLITEEPNKPLSLRTNLRYGSFNTIDAGINAGTCTSNGNTGASLYINRLSSEGYNISDQYFGKTIPDYQDYTLGSEIFHKFNPFTDLKLNFRYNKNSYQNEFLTLKQNPIDDHGSLNDLNLSITTKHQYTQSMNVEGKLYYTNYRTEYKYTFQEFKDSLYEEGFFDQSLLKGEFGSNLMVSNTQILSFGTGYNSEELKTMRIDDNKRQSNSLFVYVQDDIILSKDYNVIGSARYDSHSDYKDNISGKLAASGKIFDGFLLKASIGSGYKAPTFQQLYLDWSNPLAGYSVFGVSNFKKGILKIKDQIDKSINIDSLTTNFVEFLNPESSLSFNLGINFDYNDRLNFKLNMFRNNLTNMIEYTPIVKKNNGMYVYSYRNFNEVYTQGSELQISHNPLDFLEVSIGFQYLESADIKVLDRIKKGEIGYLDKNQEYIKITSSDYGGLFNRSKYTANFIIKYKSEEFGFTSAIRGTYRSRYGFTDLNDNQVLDADNEYAPGYSIINWTLNKNLLDNLVLQFGIDNLLDYKDTKFVLTNPGRTFFLSLSFNLINE